MKAVKGRVVTPQGIVRGSVLIEAGTITKVDPTPKQDEATCDFDDALIVPGFIDLHLHGMREYSFATIEGMLGAAAVEPQFGTTGFLPTAFNSSEDAYLEFGCNIRTAQSKTNDASADILGAHFEGPFINPDRKGGMTADHLRPMSMTEASRYVAEIGDVLKLITLSPEMEGSAEVIQLLSNHGVVVSLGHSLATHQELAPAVDSGLSHICHLYDTFLPPTEVKNGVWQPSLVPSILANDALTCEIICDMCHVIPEWVKLSARILAPNRFVAITDAMPGAGLPAGTYLTDDGREYSTEEGAAFTTGKRVLIGSVLTMNRAFGNLVDVVGLDHVTASNFTSLNPARVLGIDDTRGTIEPGKRADLAVLDADYNCVATFVAGKKAYQA